jgi:hypothetical protein
MFRSNQSAPVRRVLLLAGVAAVVAAFVLPAVASADSMPTSVKLSQNAQWVAPFEIDVPIALSCTAGAGYWVSVNVVQPQGFGFTLFGGGNAYGQCTGQQQKLAVAVYPFGSFGTWLVGDASATAEACTYVACASDTKQIHVGL